MFRREGFARARLEDVAVEVGINRASLYYYVGTKEELLVALIEQPAYTMTRHCREALDSDSPADDKLRRALHAYIEDLANSPEVFLLFSESQHLGAIPEAQDIVANADALAKRKDAIVRFMKAYRETITYMYSDNPQVMKDYGEFAGVSEAMARRVRDEFFPQSLVDPNEIHGLDGLMADAVALKFIPAPLTKEQVADLIQIVK